MGGQAVIRDPIFKGQGCRALLRNAPGSGNFEAVFISTSPLEGSGFCWAIFSGEQWSSSHFAEAAGHPWGSVYGVRIGVCPGLGPEAWLWWWRAQGACAGPCFLPPALQKWQLGFWTLCILFRLCPNCAVGAVLFSPL